MRTRIVPIAGITLLLATAQVCSAQVWQNGVGNPTSVGDITISQFGLNAMHAGGCAPSATNRSFQFSDATEDFTGTYGDTSTFFSLPANAQASETFDLLFYIHVPPAFPGKTTEEIAADLNIRLGSEAADGSGEFQWDSEAGWGSPFVQPVGMIRVNVMFNYEPKSAYSSNGVRQFALRMDLSREEGVVRDMDIRFRAVMVGASYTDVLGYYTAPQLPLFILRDPPGDKSYSKMSTGSTTCFGQSQSVSTSESASTWFKAKIGVSGSLGLGVTTDYEIFAELGVSLEASQSETSDFKYQTCISATDEFTTSSSGAPDDLFIGSAVHYAYGMLTEVERPSCGSTTRKAYFASTPVGVESGYHYTESHILGEVIPGLEQLMADAPVGSPAYRTAMNQRDVWVQTLAMNNNIKATAPAANPPQRSFNGGGAGFNHSLVTTTSMTNAIDYTVSLDAGLSAEFGVDVGGSGVSGGGELRMRSEYGNGVDESNESTNTMSYHLEDDDQGADAFTVNIREDRVFGTYVFQLDSALSKTSCPYEGGYQLDQPSLSVGAAGSTSMILNEVPLGGGGGPGVANFPLILCNNSNVSRTYFLKFDAVTNGGNASLTALGNTINSNDNGIEITLSAGQCLNTILTLTPPNAGVVDFPNINLYLYSLCDPDIRSYIAISAFFGTGNFGDYCAPVSANGTSDGDFVDGVQIGAINNTGTGSAGGPTYTNYSGEFSTPLSRNAQSMITITSGEYHTDWYAAWIDYNKNGEFEEDEMLGSFQSSDPYQAHNIDFTVPATAQLGSTILRVRGVYLLGSEPQPIDVCFNYSYGETEDYAVVINGNIPQDCVGADNGPALPGTPCDDGNSSTADDMYDANCLCVGQLTTAVADGAGTPMRFTVQPNPSTGMFQLNNPRQVLARMEVRDALGRLVVAETTVTSRKATFDLSTVPTGLYHLLVESEGRRDVIKISVQR